MLIKYFNRTKDHFYDNFYRDLEKNFISNSYWKQKSVKEEEKDLEKKLYSSKDTVYSKN